MPLGMIGNQEEAFHIHEGGPIHGRAGAVEHSDDLKGNVLFSTHAVQRLETIANFQVQMLGDFGADDGGAEFMLLEIVALRELPGCSLAEHFRRCAHDAELAIFAHDVAQAHGNCQPPRRWQICRLDGR